MATPTTSSRLEQALRSAVQSIQWTYSLFWQLCPKQGVLVWGDGYYNGSIKTRKTVQPVELSTEEASLHRSQQLRELYESLSAGETSQTARRPCASLLPEDLTESEWFYLMCVSFSFPPGIGAKSFSTLVANNTKSTASLTSSQAACDTNSRSVHSSSSCAVGGKLSTSVQTALNLRPTIQRIRWLDVRAW